MAIELSAKIPCAELKPLGDIPEIKLLGGVDLTAFVDISAGPPTDCKLTMNLLVQLAPLLASLTCLFKILNVIAALKDFAQGATDPLNKLPGAVPGLVGAIDKLFECIPPLQLPRLALMLKGMLELVLRFLGCFLAQIDSLLEFRGSLQVSADGNPVLQEALACAERSVDAAQANLLKSLGPLKPVMDIVGMVADVAGISLEIPDFAGMSAATDLRQTIGTVKQAVDALQAVVEGIPG